jgi:hypothetical protein
MITWILLSLALSLFLGLYLAAPVFNSRLPLQPIAESQVAPSDSERRLLESKEHLLRSLKDLELDFSMGKVSKDEYESSYAELSLDVARIIKELRGHE